MTIADSGELIGSSVAMRTLRQAIRKVAMVDASVFMFGESGTGKELIARTLHAVSPRADRPFVAVNCGAIPQHLFEAQLFGHERGSFTGATRRHSGYFERADGGTLFLDEVTEMPAELQVKLLRVVESGCFRRVGGRESIRVDTRLVSATNRDPRTVVSSGRLRQDLLYRLAVIPLAVAPLRHRDDDALLLAAHFLAVFNARVGARKRFSDGTLDALVRHDWPGNVRELRNAVERSFILANDFVEWSRPSIRSMKKISRSGHLDVDVGTALADVQREFILATLSHFGGDKPRAAIALGVSLKTLYNRLHAYGRPPSVLAS